MTLKFKNLPVLKLLSMLFNKLLLKLDESYSISSYLSNHHHPWETVTYKRSDYCIRCHLCKWWNQSKLVTNTLEVSPGRSLSSVNRSALRIFTSSSSELSHLTDSGSMVTAWIQGNKVAWSAFNLIDLLLRILVRPLYEIEHHSKCHFDDSFSCHII